MTAQIEGFGANEVTTFNNATQQTLQVLTVPENSAGWLTVRVVARRVSDGATKVFDFSLGFKRGEEDADVFGVSLLSTKGTLGDLIALATVVAMVDAVDSDIRIRVTGVASTEIDWMSSLLGEAVKHV